MATLKTSVVQAAAMTAFVDATAGMMFLTTPAITTRIHQGPLVNLKMVKI